MKIRYSFVNETIEVEVDKEWGEVLLDLDRQQYNNNHKETRRHTTLNNRKEEGEWLSFDPDFYGLLAQKDTAARVHRAVNMLKPKQRDLIYALYLSDTPLSQAEYAVKLGIAEESVKQNAWRARNTIKKFFEKCRP